jgi:3-dehydroquinate synthase
METLEISTRSKSYPVWIGAGIRHKATELLSQSIRNTSTVLIITDDKVGSHYLKDVTEAFDITSKIFTYTIPSGEQYKSFEKYYELQTFALECGLDRRSAIIALGGGVIGDLAGFVAATYMRGIQFIQIPTTLLAHDSSVGGKVAINHPLGKNMIGAFYQPDAVLYDTETLETLPPVEWRSGFAEIAKHGLISDLSYYNWLIRHIETLPMKIDQSIESVLKQAINVKAEIVREDEKETGIRAHLNFGHTLGHAIETELGYGKITHGEAVAIGMVFAMKWSERQFNVSLPIEQLVTWFKKLKLPTEIPAQLNAASLVSRMKRDKKSENQSIRMVLMKEIGQVETVNVDSNLLQAFLQQELNGGKG